jgi:hypothetical protein
LIPQHRLASVVIWIASLEHANFIKGLQQRFVICQSIDQLGRLDQASVLYQPQQ